MGANAQTSVPLFTAGEVLTAANQNISAGTGVPVFATTTTRDAAFGGTGEKVLAEGQLAYIEASDIVQYYNGSSWATLGPTSSGLAFISSTTIGSAVSTVAVSNVFSSTYDNYLVIVSGGASSAESGLGIQLGATTTGYYYGAIRLTYAGSGNNLNGDNIASWPQIGRGNADGLHLVATIVSPNLAKNTFYSAGVAGSTSNASPMGISGGYVGNTTAYTGFTLTTTTGTVTGGTIKVYGYANS
jgi:hypothetical protein